MLLKTPFRLVPRPLTIAIIATAMPAAMRPYWIAVAADLSCRKRSHSAAGAALRAAYQAHHLVRLNHRALYLIIIFFVSQDEEYERALIQHRDNMISQQRFDFRLPRPDRVVVAIVLAL